jgi:hypothetical protein
MLRNRRPFCRIIVFILVVWDFGGGAGRSRWTSMPLVMIAS